MNLTDIIDISKRKSEVRLKEIKEQLAIPLFRTREQSLWDGGPKRIVVIGSGIGGMAAGALFASIGHQVTVLEQHSEQIGGHGRCPTFGGLRFSMGPQYVWEFGEDMFGDRFLNFLGLREAVPFVSMNQDGFERIFIGDQKPGGNCCMVDFKVPLGLENFRRALQELFPEERAHLDALFDDMIAIFDTYKSFFRKNYASEGRFLLATKFLMTGSVPMAMKLKLGRTIYMPLKAFFDQYQINNLLRRILYGHGGIFAENESEMSAIAYIVGTGNYHEGAWYPAKGFHHFFNALASVIKGAGGSVNIGKRVVHLETENHLVTRAVCDDGSDYACDFAFSDISPRLTFNLLDRPEEEFDYTPSHSIVTCCIGIRPGLPGIGEMRGRNYWWQDGCEVDYNQPDVTAPPRMLFIGSPTANGFGRTDDAADDALVVFCPGNYARETEICEKGPDAMKAFKNKLAADIVGILERNLFPGIAARLRFTEVISSVDCKDHTGGEFGNAYGRRLTVEEILKGAIHENDCPANLYNVSATKNSPGIAAGIFTAKLLFEELTGQTI
jgi:phytoene dehydrogenase-like protein